MHMSNLTRQVQITLIKRIILPEKNGVYDLLGSSKLLTQYLSAGQSKFLDWDDFVPTDLIQEWILFFRDLFQMKSVKF